MAKSYKGREVNMTAIAAKHKNTMCLGNTKTDAEGNLYERGKMIKTAKELAEEAESAVVYKTGTVNLNSDSLLEETTENPTEKFTVAAPKKVEKTPEYKDITEEEKKELETAKETLSEKEVTNND